MSNKKTINGREALDAQVRLMEANAANAARGRQGKRAGMANMLITLRAGMESINRAEEQMDTTSYFANEAMKQQARS